MLTTINKISCNLKDEMKKKNKEIQKLKDQMQSQSAKDLFSNKQDLLLLFNHYNATN